MTEADGAAEDSGGGVGQVDAGRAVHPHPRAPTAELLQRPPARYRPGKRPRESTLKVPTPDDRTRASVGPLQRRLRNTVDVQRFSDDRRVPLVGERQPGQTGDRLTVAQQAEQDRRRRQTRGVVERAVDRVEHPHQRRVDRRAAELLTVHADAGGRLAAPRRPDARWRGRPRWRSRCPSSATAESAPMAGDERLGRVVEDRRGLRRPARRDRPRRAPSPTTDSPRRAPAGSVKRPA